MQLFSQFWTLFGLSVPKSQGAEINTLFEKVDLYIIGNEVTKRAYKDLF